MTVLVYAVLTLVAVGVLTFGLYAPRHGRRDLVAAFFGVSVGVFAVSSILGSAAIGIGVGLGLFGVLSIIRLRSDELAQHEIAYYFSALAVGLIGGLGVMPLTVTGALMAMIVGVMFVADHPAVLRRHDHQLVVLDEAINDHDLLNLRLGQLLGAHVIESRVVKLDLVNDSTTVDVRFRRTSAREPVSTAGGNLIGELR